MFKTTDTSYQSGSVDDYEVLGKYLTFNTPLTIMDIHMLHEYYDKCSYKNSNDKEITCSIHYSYQELSKALIENEKPFHHHISGYNPSL